MYVQLLIVTVICFLLFITPFRFLLNFFNNRENSLFIKGIFFSLITSLAAVCLYLIADATVPPHVTVGEKNPALFIIVPFLMIFTLYLTLLFFFTTHILSKFPRVKPWLVLFIIGLGIFSVVKAGTMSISLIGELGGGPDVEHSIIYQFPWINPYTNTLFFNPYMFMFISSVTCLCSFPFVNHQDHHSHPIVSDNH